MPRRTLSGRGLQSKRLDSLPNRPWQSGQNCVSSSLKGAAFQAEQKTSRELRLYLWLRGIWGTHSWCFLQEETEVHLEGQRICSGFSRLPRC